MAKTQFGRNPQNIKFLTMCCPVLGRTEEEAVRKFDDYRQYGSTEGALALFGGWTGIDLGKYGDDEELRQVESNAIKYDLTFIFLGMMAVLTLTVASGLQ